MSETENSESAATPECPDSQKDTELISNEPLDSLEVASQSRNLNTKAKEDNPESNSSNEPNPSSLDVAGQNENPTPKKNKVDVLFKATGNAPIMKRKRWMVDSDKTVGMIINFLKNKVLHLGPNESLFLYVNQSFAPSPDQIMRNLFECFGTDGKLILHYCKTQAWG